MHVLLIFVDGIGLGPDDRKINPFSIAKMPTLTRLTNDKRWVQGIGHQESGRALFRPVDPRMDVPGRPQSGSNHATIITGKPIPQLIGEHYGPKPNAQTREIVDEGSLFSELINFGKTADLLTAYPPRFLNSIERGKRLPSAFQQAARSAGLPWHSTDDLIKQNAVSADWTGQAWHSYFELTDVPLYSPYEAGQQLVTLSRRYDFAMHSHVFTDFVGHRGTLEEGVGLLEILDGVMTGIIDTWEDDEGLVLLTSDHGNMEVIGDRRHTTHDVPFLVIGDQRDNFMENVKTLADIAPALRKLLLP
jgi:2,3-bisphosphoglycerate-independent phosphoglycerate mutase